MTVTNNLKPRPKANFRPGSRKYNQMMDTKRGSPWTREKSTGLLMVDRNSTPQTSKMAILQQDM